MGQARARLGKLWSEGEQLSPSAQEKSSPLRLTSRFEYQSKRLWLGEAGLCSPAGVGAGGEGDGALDASGNTSWAVRGGCGGDYGVTRPLAPLQRT